jgi:LysR family transcriptional regulator, nitrogen assimilation regulatory protein
MDLRQLDYFVHVADLGSFSRAAAVLSIAQSALSHRVRQLEVELKQPLLYRNGRGVVPTEAGRRLLVHARGILMQVERTREELAELRGTPAGHVVIGLPPTFAKLLTVPLVNAFRERFPGASLGSMEGLSASITEWVATGRADIGLVFNPVASPAIEIVPLLEEPMFLVSARRVRGRTRAQIALKELPRFPLIVPSRPNANRTLIEAELARFGLKPAIALEIDGVATVLDLVREGHGNTVLPKSSLRAYGAGDLFTLQRIVQPKLLIQVSLITSAQRPTTPLTQKVLAFIPEIVPRVLSPA